MAEKKAAFYAGTRNLYPHMVTAAKSLIANSSVEEVWFLIEDDEFPYKLPDMIKTMNVSGIIDKTFSKNGPNARCRLTFMAFVHPLAPDLFPQYDKILKLDVDTVCVDNIDELWDTDLTGMWYGCAREKLQTWHRLHDDGLYYNVGVVMYNLAKMREEDASAKIVRVLNTKYFEVFENDAMNYVGHYRIKEIPMRFNESFATGYTDDPAIVHYAGPPDWYEEGCYKAARLEYLKPYKAMSWKGALKKHENLVSRSNV